MAFFQKTHLVQCTSNMVAFSSTTHYIHRPFTVQMHSNSNTAKSHLINTIANIRKWHHLT